MEAVGEVCRCEGFLQLVVDEQGGTKVDTIRPGETGSEIIAKDRDGCGKRSPGSKLLAGDR